MKTKYSVWKRFIILINGRAKVGLREYPNGNYLMYYVAKCKQHGYFEDYAHGYSDYLSCPGCTQR